MGYYEGLSCCSCPFTKVLHAKVRFKYVSFIQKQKNKRSSCGSVGREVASNSYGLQFESSHQQNLMLKYTSKWLETMKIKKKRGREGVIEH